MQTDPVAQSTIEFEISAVYQIYVALARDLDPEFGLGGRLLYAGEIDIAGARLVRAANIAGAGSLSATADPAAQKLAIRSGVIDFLVTSLDEALRILKNEIRKRQTVAVGVAMAPAAMLEEMIERGVLPDLLPPRKDSDPDAKDEPLVALGARRIMFPPEEAPHRLVFTTQPGPDFEARALACVDPDDHAARRWLRLSSRYLGPEARRIRSLPSNAELAAMLNAV